MNIVDKYNWVVDHPLIGDKDFQSCIELSPHMVNPETKSICKDRTLNTEIAWWIEVSCYEKPQDEHQTHYWELDCGGKSVEEAIDKLYSLVLEKYGDYK